MSAEIVFVVDALAGRDGREAQLEDLEVVLSALTLVNARYLAGHPEAPKLAEAGMGLEPMPLKRAWRDVPTILAEAASRGSRRTLSRPEAACWRAAEIVLEQGPHAIEQIARPSLLPLGAPRCPLLIASLDDENALPIAHQDLDTLLAALALIDLHYLLRHPETPNLYDAGIRYKEEPPGQEDWLDVPNAIREGRANRSVDCEDIACWRAAELNVRFGMPARPTFSFQKLPSGANLYHIQVLYPTGLVEDPCRKLGMK